MPSLHQLYAKPFETTNPFGLVLQEVKTVPYVEGGVSALDHYDHHAFSLTADGTGTTIAHSNVPTTGNRYVFELHLDWVSGTITWPASWSKGESPPNSIGNYIINGVTVDGGVSFTITVVYQ